MALTPEQVKELEKIQASSPNPLEASAPEGQDTWVDLTRATTQGLTFGFADEIEAGVRAALDSDADYAEVVAEVRNQINNYREREPLAAFGAEIAGSVLPIIAAQFVPGVGQAAAAGRIAKLASGISKIKSPVAKAALTSGGQGALYGAGTGEGGIAERAKSAAIAGPIAAVGGAALQKVAPRITAKATELIKKGVPVTPGQAVRGSSVIGDTLATVEEKVASTVPLLGDAIKGAFDRARVGFNRVTVEEALGPIGVKVPKGKEGTDLMRLGEDKIDQAYASVLKNMKMKEAMPFFEGVIKVTDNVYDDIKDDIFERAEKIIFRAFDEGGGELSGRAVKKVQSLLRKDIYALRTTAHNNESAGRAADAMQDILAVFSHQLAKENPKLARRLMDVDKAYGNFEIVRNAVIRRKMDPDFTPGDLLQESFKADPTRRKSQFSKGAARMQPTARLAQDVIGRTIPDSGTAGRNLIAGGIGYGSVMEPIIGASALGGGSAAYSRAGVPLTRGAVNLAGRTMKQAVPVAAAQISQADAQEKVRQMLARAVSGR